MTLGKQQNSKKRKNYDSLLLIFFVALASFSLRILLSHQNSIVVQHNGEVIASVSNTIHEVRFRKNADFKWQNADKGQNLQNRDRLFTGNNSQAEIIVSKNKIRIKENSLIEIGVQTDYDVKFEFGHIVLNMQKDPIRIIIKDKRYNIQPNTSTTLAINIEKDKVEFIGDESEIVIREENKIRAVEIVEKVYFNQSFCGSKTYKARLTYQNFCLDCLDQKIFQKIEDKVFEISSDEDIFLKPGKNIFSIQGSNELCSIDLLKPKIPSISLDTQNVLLTYEEKLAQIKTKFIDANNFDDKYFVLEVSRSNNFRLATKITQVDDDFFLKLKDEGTYFLRLKTCVENDCSDFSDIQKVTILKPEKLPSPILNKQYKIKKKNLNTDRSPDSDENIFQFQEVTGAIRYRYEINGDNDLFIQGELSSPELDLSNLPVGKYKLRIASIDRWDRLGDWAETIIEIESDEEKNSDHDLNFAKESKEQPHEDAKHKDAENDYRYFYNYFVGPSFYQLKQTGSAGKANGASFSPSYLNSSFGFERKNFNAWLKYQSSEVLAQSNTNQNRIKTTELLLDFNISNLKLGLGFRKFPYINVQESTFSLQPKSSTFFEIGYSFLLSEDWKKTDARLDLKFRTDITSGPMQKYDGLIANFDVLTNIFKNQIYWYNGVEIAVERLTIRENSLQARQLVLRELLKTGLTFEF